MLPQDLDTNTLKRIIDENLGSISLKENNLSITHTDHDILSGKAKNTLTTEVSVQLIKGHIESLKSDVKILESVINNWNYILEKATV